MRGDQDALCRAEPRCIGRILPFDDRAATLCAAMHVPRTRSERDAMIAGTALAHGMTVVTRNTGDFAGCGVALINPWEHGSVNVPAVVP